MHPELDPVPVFNPVSSCGEYQLMMGWVDILSFSATNRLDNIEGIPAIMDRNKNSKRK